jgi:glycosyl transferase family 2
LTRPAVAVTAVRREERVPDFIIAVAMKCGTTSLHQILAADPRICIPDPEIFFFDLHDLVQHFDSSYRRAGRWLTQPYLPDHTRARVVLGVLRAESCSRVSNIPSGSSASIPNSRTSPLARAVGPADKIANMADIAPVTVLRATFNRAGYIGELLGSILGQSRPPAQVIVIDDGSMDDTREVLRPYAPRSAGLRAASAELLTTVPKESSPQP